MKIKIVLISLLAMLIFKSNAQSIFGEKILVVDMIANSQSSETNRDAEPNIAVDPEDVNKIVATAFTYNPSGGLDTAPIFISVDRGLNWALNNKVPSTNGRTVDISVAFSNKNHTLYTSILQNSLTTMVTLRDADPFASGLMTTLRTYAGNSHDQPYPEAISRNDGGTLKDNVYVGFNDLDADKSASCDKSNNARTAAAPAGFATTAIEVRSTYGQDGPPVRYSAHSSGVVYGAFVAWTSKTHDNGTVKSFESDIVVVRDDNYGTGASPFTALKDPSDNKAGKFVVQNVTTNFCSSAYLGNQRGALGISICVNPANSAEVWIAWLDSNTTSGKVKLHVRRSTNSGANWSADLLGVVNAINPAVAVNSKGVCGVLYQKLNGTTWETHVQRSSGGTTWSDKILNTFDNGSAYVPTSNPIGDYADMVAVGEIFFGVFSALNIPDSSKFPQGVRYLRNADFTTHQLRNLANTANVNPSIDPYFFRITPGLKFSFCKVYPKLCPIKYIDKDILHIPPYPCLVCPWPCITCAPFEIPIEEMFRHFYPDKKISTVLNVPYFHLEIEGINLRDFDIELRNADGEPLKHEINKTGRGYAVSFHPSKNNFNAKQGLHGLVITVLPKNAEAAKKGADLKYKLHVSDYRFKQFMTLKK
ncbi:MAG: hypothetical protein PHD97_06655 [Bacteroidales bacterium]|nr:hypothetical protein [Bacteroidales bacterium]